MLHVLTHPFPTRRTSELQLTRVGRASDTSFNVRWTERRYVNGAAAGLERWTAVVSIVLQPPRTEERLRTNPLGIYVNVMSWRRELDPSEGAQPCLIFSATHVSRRSCWARRFSSMTSPPHHSPPL